MTTALLDIVGKGAARKIVSSANIALQRADEIGLLTVFTRMELASAVDDTGPRAGKHNVLQGLDEEGLIGRNSRNLVHHDLIMPRNSMTFQRPRLCPFYGTQLETVLRTNGIGTVVIAGLSTSGAVLSGVLSAADRDFKVSVLQDSTGNVNGRSHNVMLSQVIPMYGEVTTAAKWAAL